MMGHRILIVEDNPDNRILVTDLLESMGFKVLHAENGEQGVQMAHSEKPDMILMDLSLPVKDGWDATREIKAVPDLNAIPVIALTAHAMTGDREKALAAGCDDYVTKPIDMADLVTKIKTCLSG